MSFYIVTEFYQIKYYRIIYRISIIISKKYLLFYIKAFLTKLLYT